MTCDPAPTSRGVGATDTRKNESRDCMVLRMKRTTDSWNRMLAELQAYRKKNGHCNVPANCRDNPPLGRWVAVQRHKRKRDRLAAPQIKALDSAGFVWGPGDAAWDREFQQLVSFRKKHGHCDVPSVWPKNPNLGSWVANQRHRKKMGKMPPYRVKRLEELGFKWSIYGQADEPIRKAVAKPAPAARRPAAEEHEERLYNLGRGVYVQYNGKGRKPKPLVDYLADSDGEYPPYIPLPPFPTTFVIGEGFRSRRHCRWKGSSRLNQEIIEYVRENGILPPQV